MFDLIMFLFYMFVTGTGLSLGFYFVTFIMSLIFGPPSTE